MLDELYERSRARTTDLAATMSAGQLGTTVPATPLWSARQLIAHLVGAAADAVAGDLPAQPGRGGAARRARRVVGGHR